MAKKKRKQKKHKAEEVSKMLDNIADLAQAINHKYDEIMKELLKNRELIKKQGKNIDEVILVKKHAGTKRK